MSDTLPQLLFLAIGGSIAPPLLLLTILLLGSRKPLPNATALALGYFTTCAAMGVAGLTLFGGAEGAASTIGRVISVMVGGLLIVLGLRSLLNAPDPDAQPPKWMESISSMSPAKAFGFGMALFPLQIKNLAIFVACINLIAAASLSPRGSAVALVLVLVVFAIPVLVLIGLYATVPYRASEVLESLRAWMEKNNRVITVVLGFVFGAFFSEASRDRKTLGSRSRFSAMYALDRAVLMAIASAVGPPVSACPSRETSSQGLRSSGMSRTRGVNGG